MMAELGARSVLAGRRAARNDRPSDACRRRFRTRCAACHMPMSQRISQRRGREGRGVRATADRRSDDDSELHRLAADGISCTVCHQIVADKLGTRESFNGQLRDAADAADGARVIFRSVSRSTRDARRSCARSPASSRPKATHIKQSELCASCHTLITQAFGPERRGHRIAARADELPGVAAQRLQPGGTRSCQSCHMPTAPGPDPHRRRCSATTRDSAGAPPVRRRQRLHGAHARTRYRTSSA